jgi:beta-glucosidase
MSQYMRRRSFLRVTALLAGTGGVGRLLAACGGAPMEARTPVAVSAVPTPSTARGQIAQPTLTQESAAVLRFPDGFRWGVATSAYQIEGAVQEDGRGESVWDRFSHTPGRTQNGDTGDVACDHYHRYAQDLDLMQALGIQSYRFSIAWPRVIPAGSGPLNPKGLDFYKRLVDGLLQRAITPLPTLWHWDTPQQLEEQGGWVNRDTAQRFAEYAATVFRSLGDLVPAWMTLNEPKTVVQVGYLYGGHAPGFNNPHKAYAALHHLLLAHGLAVQAFRASGTQGQIGIVLNLMPIYPASGDQDAAAAVRTQDGYENRLYLDPVLRGRYPEDILAAIDRESQVTTLIKAGDLAVIGAPIDLLGVNYYGPGYVQRDGNVVDGPHPRSLAGWQEIYPDGLYDLLVRIKQDYGDVPLSITENGIPTNDTLNGDRVDDRERLIFLHGHLAAAHRAIQAGVNLRSYYVWSLLDNFEWAAGYSQRWGIVYVDFQTQRRTPKRSALWYREVIRQHGLGDLL